MSEAQTESPPVTNRWVRISIAAPPEGVDVEMTEDGLLWRTKPRKVVQVFQSAPDPEADAARLAFKQEQQFERHVIEWAKGQYLALFEAEPEAPASAAPVEEDDFPGPDEKPPLDAEAEAALTTDDLLAESDEVASDVISKLSRDRRRRFTELLNVEMAELQLSRGGPKEDRRREQKIERLLGIFARAGEM